MKSFCRWAIMAILASSYSLALAGDCGCSDPCDACDPCAKKPGLLSKLFHKKCDTCDTCATCEEPAPACDACQADPCDDFCDPCAKNKPLLGFLFKKKICGSCETSCCDAAPACDTCSSCNSGCGSGWGSGCGNGHGNGFRNIFSLRRPRPWVLSHPCCDCSGQGTIIHKSPSCCE